MYVTLLLPEFCNAMPEANSPSAEAVVVGKADTWLTTCRARSWKRTKRPTDLGSIPRKKMRCLAMSRRKMNPDRAGISALIPPPQQKSAELWTAPLRPADGAETATDAAPW